ncbi:flagellar biosynthesis protein FlhB [Miltoncostaea marina]|uniref:flagellar biosynthesis protein FlhB n=1 Tax=Miltoncostaea marina TaxID=2843215 RepID=UPI001C3DF676|nr:flagellar biosynthesis protein FlhB [Miltoncostaea marina]
MGSAGDRTEKATPRRREDSRKRGQVARSMELNTGLGLLALFAMLAMLGGWLLSGLMAVMQTALGTAGETREITPSSGFALVTEAGWESLRLTAPFAAAGLLAGLVASAVQVKPGITPEVLKPRFTVLNPVNGVKKLVGPRSLVQLVKDLVKIGVTGAVAFVVIRGAIPDLQALSGSSPGLAISVVGGLIMKIGWSIVAVYIVIAIADVLYQRWQHEKDMRMTKDEVRREMREQDVNPEVKGQLKRRQREMAVRRMMAAVPDADVVITNPTHYAVALRYARSLPAPQVVAKGVDHVAFRIIGAAREAGVSVVESPPLARSLYANGEIGQYIPADAFGAVAEILAHVYRATGRQPAAA